MNNVDRLVRDAVRQGWRLRRGKHNILYAPDGKSIVVVSVSPSDVRSYNAALARMRRAGFRSDK